MFIGRRLNTVVFVNPMPSGTVHFVTVGGVPPRRHDRAEGQSPTAIEIVVHERLDGQEVRCRIAGGVRTSATPG